MDLWYYRLGMFFKSILNVNLKLRSTKETGNKDGGQKDDLLRRANIYKKVLFHHSGVWH